MMKWEMMRVQKRVAASGSRCCVSDGAAVDRGASLQPSQLHVQTHDLAGCRDFPPASSWDPVASSGVPMIRQLSGPSSFSDVQSRT